MLELFNPEDDRAGGDAVEFFDFCECCFERAEGAGVEKEDHFDEFGVGVIRVNGGVGA